MDPFRYEGAVLGVNCLPSGMDLLCQSTPEEFIAKARVMAKQMEEGARLLGTSRCQLTRGEFS